MPGDFLASLPITRVGSAKNITWWYVRFWCLEIPVDVCFCSKYQHRRLVLNSFESQFWAWCFSTEVDTLEDHFILCMRMCILSTPVWGSMHSYLPPQTYCTCLGMRVRLDERALWERHHLLQYEPISPNKETESEKKCSISIPLEHTHTLFHTQAVTNTLFKVRM